LPADFEPKLVWVEEVIADVTFQIALQAILALVITSAIFK
jgi:hypothetical protein